MLHKFCRHYDSESSTLNGIERFNKGKKTQLPGNEELLNGIERFNKGKKTQLPGTEELCLSAYILKMYKRAK